MSLLPTPDLEVKFRADAPGKTVIEGKTAVPFQSFVTLILQRKVMPLLKERGREPVVVGSELLTALASAPQDSVENRTHIIIVTFGVGIVAGIFVSAGVELAFINLDVILGPREYLLTMGGIFAVAMLGLALAKIQARRGGERLAETMEKIAGFLGK